MRVVRIKALASLLVLSSTAGCDLPSMLYATRFDSDGDGQPDEEDCAPDNPDVQTDADGDGWLSVDCVFTVGHDRSWLADCDDTPDDDDPEIGKVASEIHPWQEDGLSEDTPITTVFTGDAMVWERAAGKQAQCDEPPRWTTDGIDNDCDGLVDVLDYDGDNWAYAPDELLAQSDCDDCDYDRNPGLDEYGDESYHYDGIDNDCDGADLTDVDGDGYDGGPSGSDCDDTRGSGEAINPGVVERCDTIDWDCDGERVDLPGKVGGGFDYQEDDERLLLYVDATYSGEEWDGLRNGTNGSDTSAGVPFATIGQAMGQLADCSLGLTCEEPGCGGLDSVALEIVVRGGEAGVVYSESVSVDISALPALREVTLRADETQVTPTLEPAGDRFLSMAMAPGQALIVRGLAFSDGSGGALELQGGSLVVEDSSFHALIAGTGDGGAVLAEQMVGVAVSDSSFDNCSATDGGALYIEGAQLHIVRSSFSDNTAPAAGGAVMFSGQGADADWPLGLCDEALCLDNTVFVGNSAISGAGGALFADGVIDEVLVHCSRFGGAAGDALDLCRVDPLVGASDPIESSPDRNIAGGSGGALYLYSTSARATFTNDACESVNPDGLIFQDNYARQRGGAIYAVVGELDMRGPVLWSNCAGDDGGALYTETYPVDSKDRHAVRSGAIAITDANLYDNASGYSGGGAYAWSGGDIRLSGLVLESNDTEDDQNGSGGGLYLAAVSEDTTISLSDVYAVNNTADDYAGGVYVVGALDLEDVEFSANVTEDYDGGALWVAGALSLAGDVTFSGNVAGLDGGAIWNTGSLNLEGAVSFSGNTAGSDGGAIWGDGPLALGEEADSEALFEDNSSDADGGAIWVEGVVDITRARFTGNVAGDDGGAVMMYPANADEVDSELADVTFSDNVANATTGQGGAIRISEGDVTIEGGLFERNSAGEGGGVYGEYLGLLSLDDSTFEDNAASYHGGAIWLRSSDLTIGHETDTDNVNYFTDNRAAHSGTYSGAAGAVGVYSGSQVEIYNARFERNCVGDSPANCGGVDGDANGNGGALYLDGLNSVDIQGTAFVENAADGWGGGAYVLFSNVEILNSLFSGNAADGLGGGAYFTNSPGVSVTGTLFENNQADGGGGMSVYQAGFDGAYLRFHNNTVGDEGGGLRLNDCTQSGLDHAMFSENQGPEGAAIFITRTNLIIDAVTVYGSRDSGGQDYAVYNEAYQGTIRNSLLVDNAVFGYYASKNKNNQNISCNGFANNTGGDLDYSGSNNTTAQYNDFPASGVEFDALMETDPDSDTFLLSGAAWTNTGGTSCDWGDPGQPGAYADGASTSGADWTSNYNPPAL